MAKNGAGTVSQLPPRDSKKEKGGQGETGREKGGQVPFLSFGGMVIVPFLCRPYMSRARSADLRPKVRGSSGVQIGVFPSAGSDTADAQSGAPLLFLRASADVLRHAKPFPERPLTLESRSALRAPVVS